MGEEGGEREVLICALVCWMDPGACFALSKERFLLLALVSICLSYSKRNLGICYECKICQHIHTLQSVLPCFHLAIEDRTVNLGQS